MPARTLVSGSVNGSGDGQPRVERRDRRVRAKREDSAGVEERTERERAPRAAGPVAVSDISVVESVLGLDASDHGHLRKTAEVAVIEQLRVLDASARAGARKSLQRQGIGTIADCVDRAFEAGVFGANHEPRELVEWHEKDAKLVGRARGCRIRVVAERGARVQRAIDDDLQRPDHEQPAGSVDDDPGTHVLRECIVESLRPYRADDAKRSIAVRHPAPPRLQRPRLLHIHDADDTSGGGSVRRGVAPGIGDVIGNRPDLTDDQHRRVLAQQSRRMVGVSEHAESGRVEPGAVQISTDQHHGHLAARLVEHLAMGHLRPERIAKSVSDDRDVDIVSVGADVRRNQSRRRGCGLDAGQVETRPDLCPLVEMDVAIPESGQQKPAVEVDHLSHLPSGFEVTDFGHHTGGNQDVLRWSLRPEACMAEQDGRQGDGTTVLRKRGPLSAVHGLQTGTVIAVSLIALIATLAASEVLVRGVGRLARNLGLLGGVVGLIVALCADSPEISSSVSAVAGGSAATAAGVVFGSNVFNIAVLLGGAALAAGEVRIPPAALAIDAGVAILVTLSIGLVVLGALPVPVGLFLMLVVFVPYVVFLILRTSTIARLPLASRLTALLVSASREAGVEGMELETELEGLRPTAQSRRWRPVVLMAPALLVIVIGSLLMVQGAVTLGERWGVASVLVGVVALAAATSLPNAYAAIRLGHDGRGAAVVSATFNSNTLNLIAGIAVPIILFPALRGSVPAGYVVWLVGMSVLALILLAAGLNRRGALLLLVVYGGFVAYAVLTA
jgi:cation:H+ antiporter